mgnify:CR=1 FL=1
MLTWKNRPYNDVEYCLETMKILHEMALTDDQLRLALLFFFPDLYESDGKWAGEIDIDKDIHQIQHIHTSYGPNKPDFIAKDIEEIRKILKQKGII